MVNLERNPAYTNHNIPLDKENYYRGVEVEEYEGLWRTNPEGQDVMVGHGKGGTDRLSFQSGYPNDLYINGLVKADTIIEGTSAMPIESQDQQGYAYVPELERDKVESGETPLRIYKRRVFGGEAIHLIHVWDKVFDSFPDSSGQDNNVDR